MDSEDDSDMAEGLSIDEDEIEMLTNGMHSGQSDHNHHGAQVNDRILPLLFTGSFEEAIDAAFCCSDDEKRPLLVYVHVQEAVFKEIFYWTYLCDERIADCIMDNFIIWQWDNTTETAKTELNESWKRIFHQNFPLTNFSQDYPTLIGICHQFVENDDLFIPLTLTYRFEVLARINRLIRIHQNLAVNPFLKELHSFRQSFNAIIGLGLGFDLQEQRRLSWDVLLEISKYLPLNNAIDAFSPNILLKMKDDENFPIFLSNERSLVFSAVKKLFKPNRIQSFHLHQSNLTSMFDFKEYEFVQNVRSLHLYNFPNAFHIETCLRTFQSLERLSLWFLDEFNFDATILHHLRLPSTISHFRIHCAGVSCSHQPMENVWNSSIVETMPSVTYFLFDLDCYALISTEQCKKGRTTCFFDQMANFIRKMINVKVIRFRLSSVHVEKLFHRDIWRNLIEHCRDLNKIFINVIKESEETNLIEHAAEIERDLQNIRLEVIFRLIF